MCGNEILIKHLASCACCARTLFLFFDQVIQAVRIVDILIPDKAVIHSSVRLSCVLDLEEDTLYSLKWYMNGSEVASLMPLRNQSRELYPLPQVALSFAYNDSSADLMIEDVTWSCEGTWVCEVFADGSFQRDEQVGLMIVIGERLPLLL